jgi:PAS domain-containing protein
MGTEEVLAAIATGVWRWDSAAGTVTLDAEAARLLGLPMDVTEQPEAAVRARFHPVDWNEMRGVVNLSIAEDTVAEALMRIVDDKGHVLRTVRSRSKPQLMGQEPDLYVGVGILQEVGEPHPGAAGTGAAPARRSCWTRAGRSPRPGRPRRCCGSRPRCRCPVSPRTASRSSGWRASA